MERFWGRGPNRNSAPRKRSVVCSFWPFPRHKKSSPDTYRASDPSEVWMHSHCQTVLRLALRHRPCLPESLFTWFQTHSKRSLRSSSKSHSKKRQGGSDLIDTEVNTRDLSHLSFSRPPPRITSAVEEQLSKVLHACCCLLLFPGTHWSPPVPVTILFTLHLSLLTALLM